MDKDNKSTENELAPEDDAWPRKLNRILLGVGALAFGLIIADRLVDMFQADDLPDLVELAPAMPDQHTDESVLPSTSPELVSSETEAEPAYEEPLNIEGVFGSRLVFVSASKPFYVVTEDERRIDVGSNIDDSTVLAGVTGQRVILEREGNLVALGLPEPSAVATE